MYNLLWGLPVLKTKIDPKEFNKKNILNTIEKNYQKKQVIQKWSKSLFKTDIHHSLGDDQNSEFDSPDYSELIKCYEKPIKDYLKTINFQKTTKFKYEIVNYTAAKHVSFMEPHLHIDCEFSMIHYLKFDNKQNSPTVFMSPYSFVDYWVSKKKMQEKVKIDNTMQSWSCGEWQYPTEEDDCLIFPAILKHFVKNKKSDDLRVVLSSNISILED